MKTTITTFALSFALCAAAGATAQAWSTGSAPKADTVMLSQTIDGDYHVRRFIVKSQNASDYSVRYHISMATLNATFDGNTTKLSELDSFVQQLMRDSLMHIKEVTITGYASPDGPMKFNETLAHNRAQSFKSYVDKKYHFSTKYKVQINAVADDWMMTRELVAQSAIPDKAQVLAVIDGKQWTPAQKEQALKKMPAAWNYLAKNILPPLRRVELAITYAEGNVVTQRTLIPKPKPAPAPKAAEPCCEVVDETITGILVEMPESDRAINRDARHAMREIGTMTKAELKAANKEAKIADKLAKKEAKVADKIAKKLSREANKMAKAAEKAARKIAKEQAKADRIAAKAISRM